MIIRESSTDATRNTQDSSNPWHRRQTCPNCGSNNLTITAEHDTSGYNGYRCNACGCVFGN